MKVRKYSNVNRWFIDTENEPLPHPHRVPDWSTCPGTLFQDFKSPEEALEVANWWGYQPVKHSQERDYLHSWGL